MPKESTLDSVQRNRANDLRLVRPAVIPGTNAIVDNQLRGAWYALVNDVMRAHSIDGAAQVAEFCDLAGVAN